MKNFFINLKRKMQKLTHYIFVFINFSSFIFLGFLTKDSDKTCRLLFKTHSVNKILSNQFSAIDKYFSTHNNSNINITSNISYYKNQHAIIHYVKKAITITPYIDEVKESYRVPDIAFYDESDNVYNIKSFHNNLVILYFWATWCLECTEELLQLNQLQKKLAYEDINDIIIIPISTDFKNIESIYNLYQVKDIDTIGLFIDRQRALTGALNISSLPSTILVSKQGIIIANIRQSIPWCSNETHDALMQLRDWTL